MFCAHKPGIAGELFNNNMIPIFTLINLWSITS